MAQLRRGLNVGEAIGISIALMAPSMAANINPQATAGSVGRAVPLAFGLATVGVLLVAYAFVRLCQHFHHAGSVYGFVGATLGARTGLVAGWALLGTYVLYGVVTSTAAGIFGVSFLDETGVWHRPPAWAPFLVGALALLGVLALTVSPVRSATRVLLAAEGVTVLLILAISLVVLVRLLDGSAPQGHRFTLSVFEVPSGTGVSTLFLGAVFGFLSFAGFEAAATLGEESRRPRRDIPRAILGTAIFGGVYFVVVTAVEMMGFGSDAAGVKAFTDSGSLLGDLGTGYVGAWAGDLVTLGAAVSAFGCALASAVGASRLGFAFGRDGVVPPALGEVSPRRGTPHVAAVTVVTMMGLVVLVDALVFSAKAFDVFLWSGTIGTLILLVAYVLATLGAIRLLFFSGRPRSGPAFPGPELPGRAPAAGRPSVRRAEIVIPLLALVVIGYTLYRNVVPYPTGAAAWFPLVCLIWLLLAVIYVLARPAVARRAGRHLAVSTAPPTDDPPAAVPAAAGPSAVAPSAAGPAAAGPSGDDPSSPGPEAEHV